MLSLSVEYFRSFDQEISKNDPETSTLDPEQHSLIRKKKVFG